MVLRYGNHVGDPALNDLEGHDLKPEILYFRELLPRPPEAIAESYRLPATAEFNWFRSRLPQGSAPLSAPQSVPV